MSQFAIETDKPIEKTPRKAPSRKSKYPFADLEVGQSFFIPSTGDKPRPWKSMGSGIYWANRRYAGRVFEIHKVEDVELGLGARIWRKA